MPIIDWGWAAMGVATFGLATYYYLRNPVFPQEKQTITIPGPGTFPFDYQPRGFDPERFPNGNWNSLVKWGLIGFGAYKIYDEYKRKIYGIYKYRSMPILYNLWKYSFK